MLCFSLTDSCGINMRYVVSCHLPFMEHVSRTTINRSKHLSVISTFACLLACLFLAFPVFTLFICLLACLFICLFSIFVFCCLPPSFLPSFLPFLPLSFLSFPSFLHSFIHSFLPFFFLPSFLPSFRPSSFLVHQPETQNPPNLPRNVHKFPSARAPVCFGILQNHSKITHLHTGQSPSLLWCFLIPQGIHAYSLSTKLVPWPLRNMYSPHIWDHMGCRRFYGTWAALTFLLKCLYLFGFQGLSQRLHHHYPSNFSDPIRTMASGRPHLKQV